MSDADYRAGLKDQDDRPDHLLRWLEEAQRRVASELDEELPDAARAVGPRRLRVLQLIPDPGCSQQDLADRALVTKQTMGELVDSLAAAGLVERVADPADGRSRVVRRTAAGETVHLATEQAMTRVERRLAASLGARRYADLRRALTALGDPAGTS